MGFDLFGINPKTPAGEYFRASIWSWPPIHMLIAQTGVLNDEELESISYNDGYFIDEDKAKRIAEGIEKIIAEYGDDATFADLESPMAKLGENLINAFIGQGVTVERGDSPLVPVSYIKEFVEFAKNNEGFEVL